MKRPFLASALLGALTLSCRTQSHTEEYKAEAQRGMAMLRSATDYDLALQQYGSGNLEQAQRSVEASLALNDQVPDSHLLRGRILLETGRFQEALEALERALALDPARPDGHYCRGIVFEQLGQLELAKEEFLAASALDPAAPHYRLAAAEVLVDMGQPDEARAQLEEGSAEFRFHPGFRQALGHLASMRGDVEAAVRFFSEAAVLSPEDPAVLEDLCRAQIQVGSVERAEAILSRLTRQAGFETRTDLKRLHATCLLQLNRPVEARAILLEMTRARQGTHDLGAWSGLVDVALMLRDDRLLWTAANRLLAAAPERFEGYQALALWQQRTGDLAGALHSAHAAVERAGENPSPGRLEAWLREQSEGGSRQESSAASRPGR